MRDYGTGEWDGGDPECDHAVKLGGHGDASAKQVTSSGTQTYQFRHTCQKCGARRIDRQLGLEQSFDEFVDSLVSVFREVRRVLAPHGTCWLNLGDSYSSGDRNGHGTRIGAKQGTNRASALGLDNVRPPTPAGLKPKDLIGQPWAVAFALRADGWYLRSCVIWAKPNPMPESVTDRPTASHEYVFLLTKQARYFYDQEAVREPAQYFGPNGSPETMDGAANARRGEMKGRAGKKTDKHPNRRVAGFNDRWDENEHERPLTRNLRSVWTIPTQPYPEAHFATYPEELVRRCLLAGCPERVCRTCGKPSERIIDVSYEKSPAHGAGSVMRGRGEPTDVNGWAGETTPRVAKRVDTTGWTDCGHDDYRPGIVLDPFLGSGTTAHVARKHGRKAVGIELNPDYCELASKRLAQQSLLAEPAA